MEDVLYRRYAHLGHVRDHYNGIFGIPRPTEIQFVFRRWEPERWSRTVYVKTNSELGAKVDFYSVNGRITEFYYFSSFVINRLRIFMKIRIFENIMKK